MSAIILPAGHAHETLMNTTTGVRKLILDQLLNTKLHIHHVGMEEADSRSALLHSDTASISPCLYKSWDGAIWRNTMALTHAVSPTSASYIPL